MTSSAIKNKILDQFDIIVHSEPGYKRNLAERAVRGK